MNTKALKQILDDPGTDFNQYQCQVNLAYLNFFSQLEGEIESLKKTVKEQNSRIDSLTLQLNNLKDKKQDKTDFSGIFSDVFGGKKK